MKVPPVKGTRDFYPEQMRIRNFIVDGWKTVSVRNGFEEYDGPIFEYLKMFQIKSGDEIAEQLFSLTDRGGRELAIRPEITPTLARMVNQKINSLPRPIKWFSVPRLCRAERPQKGRLREFFQWNVDIIGIDDVLADAETIFTAVDYLREVGLTSKDIKVKISSRWLLSEFLMAIGIDKDKLESIYPILDKKAKVPPEAFQEMLAKEIDDKNAVEMINQFMSLRNINDVDGLFSQHPKNIAELMQATINLRNLFEILQKMGIVDYCVFDPSIVRGLAYYTGMVFEIHDTVGELRAICGGGRFDNLLRDFGGPSIPATGFGMGDCILEILLREKGLLDKKLSSKQLDYFVVYVDKKYQGEAIQVTTQLRSKGKGTNFSYKGGNLGKQLKQASAQNAARCIIIGQEIEAGQVVVKDMATGEQKTIGVEEFFKSI
jgi:histidyl-tRNA synthetase